MRILLSNDDGIHARGLQCLARSLSGLGEVVIVAPDRERSSSSSALTLRQKLYLEEHPWGIPNVTAYSFTGMPADCTKFALSYFMQDEMPDLVVAGMNNGYNSGSDVIYSGTVAAALEGIFHGIPALAVSGPSFDEEFLERAIPFVRNFIETIYIQGKYTGLLNLNIPNIENIGWPNLKVCRQGLQDYVSAISEQIDDQGRPYYWVAGKPAVPDSGDDDVYWLHRGYLTVTPLHWLQEDISAMEGLKQLFQEKEL